ncbi:CDP-glycerol glycerophosphotransferase family protein [Geodermatophilus sp. SYSU D00815]
MRVVWSSFRGQFSDSPRALYQALQRRGDDIEHVWLAAPDRLADFPAAARTVEYGTAEARATLESADVVVAGDHVHLDWEKQPGTVYLQTWHGTPLKRIHNDVRWAPEGRLARLDRDIARWDALLSPNPASTPLFRRAFGFTGPVHETGYPRNDVLRSPDAPAIRARVRRQLGIPEGRTAVLYAPTWRDDVVFAAGPTDHEFPLDLGDFARALGDEHVLLLRLHSLVTNRPAPVPGSPFRDVTAHPDISELYLAADVLVTDYSSAMFDFAVTGKPILLFTYDLADFRDRVRGFYFDLEQIAPGPLLATSDDVLAALGDLDAVAAAHDERATRFRQTFCCRDDGHAADRVLDRFFPAATPVAAGRSTIDGGGLHAFH